MNVSATYDAPGKSESHPAMGNADLLRANAPHADASDDRCPVQSGSALATPTAGRFKRVNENECLRVH